MFVSKIVKIYYLHFRFSLKNLRHAKKQENMNTKEKNQTTESASERAHMSNLADKLYGFAYSSFFI